MHNVTTYAKVQKKDHRGTDLLCDAERYVDTGLTLAKRNTKVFDNLGKDKQSVQIWTHLNANVSRLYYYCYQDWWWENEDKDANSKKRRRYSFLGFFRKFSESDLMELTRL